MAVTDVHTTSDEASTTIAVPSVPPPPTLRQPQLDQLDQLRRSGDGNDDAGSIGAVVDLSTEVTDPRTDAELVARARTGSHDAFDALFDRWFERSWNVARTVVRQDDTAAEVAQEAMLKAWQRIDDLNEPTSFGPWLLTVTRNHALDRVRRDKRSSVVDDDLVTDLRDQQHQAGRQDWMVGGGPSVTAAVEARHQQELVWAASAALGDRDSALLDLHLRHGLTADEVASSLGVSTNNAHQRLFRLRRRLGQAIGAYVLWRGGAPLCDDLDRMLPNNEAGVRYFDRAVCKQVIKHADECDRCAAARAATLDPAALFASTPLLAVPAQLRHVVAENLADHGLPITTQSVDALPGDDILMTRALDGADAIPPTPQEAEALVSLQAQVKSTDDVADSDPGRPEWNPGPILSSAENIAPYTSPNVIEDATTTASWRSWLSSPPAMAGVGLGVVLTIMAVALAAGPELTGTETATGDFGSAISAGEASDQVTAGATGLRSVAEPGIADDGDLDAGSIGMLVEDGDSSRVSASYGAAVAVDGDDNDTALVARSAAGASAVTTDAETGRTALRDLEELVGEAAPASDETATAGTGDTAIAPGSTADGDATANSGAAATANDATGDSDDSGNSGVASESDAGSSPATPTTTGSTTSPTPPTITPTVDVSDDADERDRDDERGDPSDDGAGSGPPVTSDTTPSTTKSPASQPRPTEPPTTVPQPTNPPTTAPPADDVADDDVEVDEPDEPDDEADDVEIDIDDEIDEIDDDEVDDSEPASANAGGTPSETRPSQGGSGGTDAESSPSDTRPSNGGASGGNTAESNPSDTRPSQGGGSGTGNGAN